MWLFGYGKCNGKNDATTFLKIGDIGFLNGIGAANIDDGTIPATAFAKDLETEVPREMSTLCIKRTFATTWDKTKWVPADGGTIGASVSNAKYRGDIYKNVFLGLGGTEGQWQSGQTKTLPNFLADNWIIENSENESFDLYIGFKSEFEYQQGLANYISLNLLEDSKCEIIVQAAGGGGGSLCGGGKKNRGGGGGGSGSGFKISGKCPSGHYKISLGVFGAGAHGSGAQFKVADAGKNGVDSVLEYNGKTAVTAGAGKAGQGGVSAKSNWFPGGLNGEGGIVTIAEDSPFTFDYAENGTGGQNARDNAHYWFYMYAASVDSPYQTKIDKTKKYGKGGDGGSSGGGDGGVAYVKFSTDGAVEGGTQDVGFIYCNFLIRL